METNMFKMHIHWWLKSFPDTPKNDNYSASVSAETNRITKQKKSGDLYIWVCLVQAKKMAWTKFGSCDFEFA